MTEPTVWPARRVGDRILCGRQVDGRYVCQGELAAVERPLIIPGVNQEVITLPGGYTEDPPGSHHWRRTARATEQAKAGRTPKGTRRSVRPPSAPPDPALPAPVARGFPGPLWTRRCPHPHCGCVARVDSAVLLSPQR